MIAQTSQFDRSALSPPGEYVTQVLQGLDGFPKSIPSHLLYDQRGSDLFEAICDTEEYYVTRTELALMQMHASEIANSVGQHATIIELGSGSGLKTELLLRSLAHPKAYVPIEISHTALYRTVEHLSVEFPDVSMTPIVEDFTKPIELPPNLQKQNRRVVYFPGSTIGNFTEAAALKLLKRIHRLCSHDGGLLIGIDLQKELDVVEAAYNDARGVTAEFTLNVLHRLNRELNSDFCVEQFKYDAFYDLAMHRIEMRLLSCRKQHVGIGDRIYRFERDEPIITEYSHKYTIEGFASMASSVAGFRLQQVWTDPQGYFAVLYFGVN